MAMTKMSAILCVCLAAYATVHQATAVPTATIRDALASLCPYFTAAPECNEDLINELLDSTSTSLDAKKYIKMAEEEELGTATGDQFESACDVLEHVCSPIVRVTNLARFVRSSSNSTETSTSTSAESSER